ncbi:MAG: putative RNA methyltransferase [Patescibacteria group bacterium]
MMQCPVCQSPLEKVEKQYVCSQNHSFDISREGYVNLLLANQKKSKEPGDGKLMIESREYFLGRGFYDRLSDRLNEMIGQMVKARMEESFAAGKPFRILDLGCGEGFYSDRLLQFLEKNNLMERVEIFGIDISKIAIQKAAKRNSRIQFCIGSNFHVPFVSESFDCIFSIFSPLDENELKRVLAHDSRFISVRPGADHLRELAALIYDEVQLQGKTLDFSGPFFLLERTSLQYEMNLASNRDITSLVAMTPYYWHLNEEKRASFDEKKALSVGVDFQFSVFRK